MRILTIAVAVSALTAPVAGHAQLPDPVRAMIDAAIASGDPKKVATIVEIAKQTNPDDVAEIRALRTAFDTDQTKIAALAAIEEEQALRSAGILDNWSGKGELGAFRATGNSSNTGISAAIQLERDGIDWSHELRGRVDYQRSNGVTTREQYFAAYEPRYQIDDGFFTYGLAQYERDRFQGFNARYSLSAGIGYTILDGPPMTLSVKAGPTLRKTEFVDGTSDSNLAGLVGLDFDWQITDRIKFTQDANAVSEGGGGSSAVLIVDSANTSLNFITGLQFKVSNDVSTRFSYQVDYESDPPAGSESTDTLSRFTLIYGF